MSLVLRICVIGSVVYRNTRNMALANLTYLDSLNRYIVLSSYKALMAICDQKVVSTQPRDNTNSAT
jgi:hypothetical protein